MTTHSPSASAELGDEGFTELLMLVSCYYGLALVLNAADLDVDAKARFRAGEEKPDDPNCLPRA